MILMMKKLIALLSILALADSFTFLYPSLQVDNSTINTVTTYKFDVSRSLDPDLNPTPYDTQLVPAGSTIIVTFPSQFNLSLTLPSCSQLLINDITIPTLQYTCSKSANNIIISGAIPNAKSIANASIKISNVTNPYPALTTDPFIIKIGLDVSAQSTTVTLTKADFAACSINFSPAVVNSTAAMIINLSPNNPVLVNGEIKIQFPSNLQWREDLSTTHPLPIASSTCSVISGQLQSGSCIGTVSTTIVLFTVSSINSSKLILPFSFQINGLFSPPTTTPPDTLTITSLSPDGYQIDSCVSSITGLIPQTLSVSIVPNTLPLYVSSSTTLTITFTIQDTLARTDFFRLIFPTGTIYAFSAVTSTTLLMFTSGAGYFPANLTLIMRQSSTSPSRNSGTLCRIIISSYTAPPSIKQTSDFIFQVISGQNGLKMQGKTTLTATAQNYVMTVTPGSLVINYATSYTFTIQFLNSITSLGYITITFPIDLSLNLPSNCLSANFTLPTSAICSVNSTTVKLSNLSNTTISSNTYSLTLSSISNPNKVVSSLSFSASFYYIDDPTYLVGTASFTGLTYLANQLNINTTQIVLSNYEVLQSPISLNLTFVLKDPVPPLGFAVIVIPPQISIVSGYIPQCLLTIATSQAASCSLTGNTFNVSLGSSSIVLGQKISIILNSFGTNPKSTRPTKTLQLYIYASGNYLINYLNSSLTITNFTPSPFLFISASPTNLTNSASTTYTFNLQQFAMWDAGAFLLIDLPSSMAAGAFLACRNPNTNTNLTCSSNGTIITVYLTANTSSLSLTISPIINPPSLRPTSILKITSYTSDGYLYSTDSSIIITTNTFSTFSNFSYTFSNRFYNQTSNLVLNIVNHASITSSYRLSNIAQFNSFGNITCFALGLPILCSLSSSNLIITANTTFSTATDITIMNLFIPMANITSLTLQSFDSTFLMSTFTPISFQTLCNIPCYTCQAATPNICQSCYPNTQFTSSIYYYQNTCLSLCPASTYASTLNNQCESCTSFCAQCTSASSNCTECSQNSSLPVLLLSNNTCINSCPFFTYPNLSTNTTKYTPICSSCVPPCSTCTSATVCLTCLNSSLYYYANQCLATCPINSTIANSTSMTCDLCNPICLTCINTTATCLKCNIAVAPFFVQQNQTCVSTCPYPLVADGISCVTCQSPCVSCSVSKSNCLSCISGMFLSLVSNGSCLSKCQSQYFGNSTTNKCQSCSSVPNLHCKSCFNQTICLICDIGFVFFPLNSTCLSQTPSGYVNISGIAVECTSNCSECSSSTYNCTACTGILSLYFFAGTGYCQQTCPTSTLSFSNVCVTCTYPCKSCSVSLNNCTECLTGYLIQQNTSFICIDSCPSNTFLNSSICQNCSLPCLKCQNSPLYCTSCSNSSFYLLNNTCVSLCPNNSLVNQLTMSCYSCIHPCMTCSVSINNCTSCASGYYFYANSNQCLTTCPINITVSDSTGSLKCLPCDSNCTTCLTSTNNCLACSAPYSFYNSSCMLSCPSGFFSGSNVCKVCVNNCLTCSSATTCQSCSSSYLFYSSQCLSTCPVNSSIIINKTCTACANNCVNCSSSNICFQCPSNKALYNEACVTSCPSPLVIYYNITNNKLNCFTSSEIAQQSLATTLKISSVLPLPFTIITAFIFLCCLMSKIQNIQTYLTGVGYSLYGCSQVGSLVYLFYIYKLGYSNSEDYSIYFLLCIIAFGIIFLLNLISLTCVTPFLLSDPQFKNWLKMKRRGTPPKDTISYESNEDAQTTQGQGENESNQCCYHSTSFCNFTVLSFIVSYKFRFIIFTKLFNFKCLTAHLQNVHGFRAYNVLSFFGILHEGLVCYITIKFLMMFGLSDSQLYLATIDCLIVTITAFLFALISTQKDDNFFKIHNDFKDGIDLGRRKKDQDRLKNLKIDDKRLKGMDSRDKLIDMNDSHTEIDEQIIVNHNIVGSSRQPKQLGNWVPVDENSRHRDLKSPRQRQYDNIFQLQNQEEDKYHRMTDRERINLFHTSIKPDRKKRKQQTKTAQSKLDEEIEVDMDEEPSVRFQKDINKQKKKVIFDIEENQPEIIISHPHSKKLNLMPSTVKIDFSGREKAEKHKVQQNIKSNKVEKQSPIKNIKSTSNHIQQSPVQNNLILLDQPQNLNKSMQVGQIQGSSQNKSFQSVLPFIHQDGILKQKRKPKQREASKQHLMIVSTKNQNQLNLIPSKQIEKKEQQSKPTPIVFSSDVIQPFPSKGENKIQAANEKNGNNLQQLLDLSDIRQEQRIIEKRPIITKATQEIQVQQLEPKIIKKSAQTAILPPKNTKFSFNSQINSHNYNKNKSPPKFSLSRIPITQKINDRIANDPLVHAPKIYKSGKMLQANETYNQLGDFDDALIKRQQQLLRIREQLNKNNLLRAQKKAQDGVRSNKRSQSKQSIKSIIDYAIKSKRGEQKSKEGSMNDEQNQDQSLEDKEDIQNIEIKQIKQIQILSLHKSQQVQDNQSKISKTIKKQFSRKQTEELPNYQREQLQINSHIKSRISHKSNNSNPISQQQLSSPTSSKKSAEIIQMIKQSYPNYSQQKSKSQSSQKYAINVKQQNKFSKQREGYSQQISYHQSQIEQIEKEDNKLVKDQNSLYQLQENQEILQNQQSKTQQPYIQKIRKNSKNENIENIVDQQNSQSIEQPSQFQQTNNQSDHLQQVNMFEPNSAQNKPQLPQNPPNIQLPLNIQTQQYLPLKYQKHLTTQKQEQQQESQQPSKPIEISIRNDYEVEQRDRPYQQQQQNDENMISNQIRSNIPNIFQQQERDQPFEVEYDGRNLEGDEQFSRKQFTVENVDRQYLDNDAENGNSSREKVNLSMRKTQKRPIRKRIPEQEPQQQISLQNQKFQTSSYIPSKQSETVRGVIKRNKNIEKIQQQQTGKDSKSNSQHVANLLKNITRQSRGKRSMPKQQKDDRIRIKLQQNKFTKPSPQSQENTNLIRKSLEKNKPINQFKFQNRKEEYSQDEQEGVNYRKPAITKQNTHLNFVKPSIPIDRSSSMRQSQPISKLKEKEISFDQRPQQILQKKEANNQIRQFDFGDQFSSDRSKNQGYSQAQLVKWKHQFLQQGSYINVQQQYQKSFQPNKPQIIHSSRFDEDEQGLEIIDEKRISRKKSRNSKSKNKKLSSGRKSELHKIYGK